MNKQFFLLFTTLFFWGCNNKVDQPGADEDTVNVIQNFYSWQATLNDSTGKLEMKRIEASGPDTLASIPVINFLNSLNPTIRLELVKISNDTIYIKIPDALYLTQQMGSTGPTLYFANAVYNLTEIPGITHVNFDFEEGDHASPGTFNRNSFKDE